MPTSSLNLERWPVRTLFGVPINAMRLRDVVGLVDETIRARNRLLIGVVNAAKLVNMRRDQTLGAAIEQTDITLADGMSVVWASRLLRRPLPERVAGIDLMYAMLTLANEKGYRVYCLGATDVVLGNVLDRIRRDYPGAVIAGARNGYFRSDDEQRIADGVRESRADMIFVAISPPKKEQFLAKWSTHMNVPVCHGVGGSFDVMAGKVRRAPALWQRLGFEWLFRVIQEPRRMWRRYLVTNTLFCWMLAREWLAQLRSSTPMQRDAVKT